MRYLLMGLIFIILCGCRAEVDQGLPYELDGSASYGMDQDKIYINTNILKNRRTVKNIDGMFTFQINGRRIEKKTKNPIVYDQFEGSEIEPKLKRLPPGKSYTLYMTFQGEANGKKIRLRSKKMIQIPGIKIDYQCKPDKITIIAKLIGIERQKGSWELTVHNKNEDPYPDDLTDPTIVDFYHKEGVERTELSGTLKRPIRAPFYIQASFWKDDVMVDWVSPYAYRRVEFDKDCKELYRF
ncbi:hypothetical protein [Marininema halotolerans]|uniref:Uncharacterized protein n=1 Tax=Marininema halotolerans TaxID=1155944 RepID=A0A1I6P806_9BACL|nr:hypothetical protein [Marininema halotolerans]SFS36321.1 hypothetical protein SAMN05444972_101419 [Marininema halotolerans]